MTELKETVLHHVLLLCLIGKIFGQSNCSVVWDNIDVEKNFQINKMLGAWYRTHVLKATQPFLVSDFSIPPHDTQKVTFKETGYGVQVETGTDDNGMCLSVTLDLMLGSVEPSKILLDGSSPYNVRILSTNYVTYSLVAVCAGAPHNNSVCSVTVWQRCADSDVPAEYTAEIDAHLTQLCSQVQQLTTEDFDSACFDMECSSENSQEVPGGSQGGGYGSSERKDDESEDGSPSIAVIVGGSVGGLVAFLVLLCMLCCICYYCC